MFHEHCQVFAPSERTNPFNSGPSLMSHSASDPVFNAAMMRGDSCQGNDSGDSI